MRGFLCVAAILLAGQPAFPEPSPESVEPPDLEFLEFLGATAGMDPEIIAFMETREARRAGKEESARSEEANVESVPWDSLDAATQSLLAGQRDGWDRLPAARQRVIADGAARQLAMSDTDQAAAQARYRTWRELPAEDRQRLRASWKRFRELTPEQQQALRDEYRRFLELPPERREATLDRWQQMSPEERRRAIQRRQGPKPGSVDRRPCPPC